MSINERVKILRKELHMTQEDFSAKINISRGNLASIEVSRVAVTDRVASDICRCFNVSEIWLRTGEGGMYSEDPVQDRFIAQVGDYASENADKRKKVIISHVMSMLDKVPDEFFEYFAESLIEIAKELREAKDQNDGE